MGRLALLALVLSLLCACTDHNRYKVIERTNVGQGHEVPVILLHDGHKYRARCNNVKGTSNPNVTLHCNLRVGQIVECQCFEDRDFNGYDLICGSKRDSGGDLAADGENELLYIDKEEN